MVVEILLRQENLMTYDAVKFLLARVRQFLVFVQPKIAPVNPPANIALLNVAILVKFFPIQIFIIYF